MSPHLVVELKPFHVHTQELGGPRPGLSTGPHACTGKVLERQAAGGSGQWPLGNMHLHLKTGCFSGCRAFPTFAGIQNGQNHYPQRRVVWMWFGAFPGIFT